MLDLHVHDAHFIRLVCGMPKAVQTVGTMRGEVVERFTTQFIFDDPAGGHGHQRRDQPAGPPLHARLRDLSGKGHALLRLRGTGHRWRPGHAADGAPDNGKVLRPKLGSAIRRTPFVAELTEMVRAVRTNTPSPLLAGELARDAVILCQKQTESVRRGRPVKV